MNHFEAHLMLSSKEVDSKILRMAVQFEYFFFLIRRQNGECYVYLEVLDISLWYGMSPDTRHSKSTFLQVTINLELE